jgi:hypothetical protein
MSREAVTRDWARRVEIVSRIRSAGICLFAVAMAGAFLLPPWWPFHSPAALAGLAVGVAGTWITAHRWYSRCPRCNEDPSPDPPWKDAPAGVRLGSRFYMRYWCSCARCGVTLR